MEFKYAFGPVPSRRLGRSLGVNVVPFKTCNYSCVYCQLGRTTCMTNERADFFPPEDILSEVREALSLNPELDYLTFTGEGEPTLCRSLGWLISRSKEISPVPVAVLTNGSLLYREEVAEALLGADVVLPSLDAATEPVFETINRPHRDLKLRRVIEGLKDFRQAFKGEIWLEVLFCRGINDGPRDIQALKEAIAEIGPDAVHLNTVVRPGAEEYASPLSHQKLEEIARELGEGAEVITSPPRKAPSPPPKDIKDRILRTLEVRPLTLEDLSRSLGLHEMEALKLLDELTDEGKVGSRIFDHRIYYEVKAS